MRTRRGAVVLLAAILTATTVLTGASLARARSHGTPAGVTVHEWGTFTSVAGADGQAVKWEPLSGPSELPCFVTELNPNSPKGTPASVVNFSDASSTSLGAIRATVRMETPVMYFYSPTEATLRVNVRFPQGLITEWYPQANVPFAAMADTGSGLIVLATASPAFAGGSIEWPSVRVHPGGAENFPVEARKSPYYSARATDADPLDVGLQHEKFLFYRGMATFPVPLSARLNDDGSVVVENRGTHLIPKLVLFERQGARIGYRVAGDAPTLLTIQRPALTGNIDSLRANLRALLIGQGLYPREAQAMIDTWQDSWFEEGTRLFYLLPQSAVDGILPLEIDPGPTQVTRVFVGRVEIITPAVQSAVEQAIRTNDQAALAARGRFLEPIAERILAKSPLPESRARVQQALQRVAAARTSAAAACAEQ